MAVTSQFTTAPERSIPARLIAGLLTNRLTILIACYIVAKLTLYWKIWPGYLAYGYPENDWFPAWVAAIPPMFVDAALVGLIIAGTRLALCLAVPLSFLMIVHPQTFGYQHYVMSSYMFLWLATRDERTGSVWFGRVTLSFLYMAATIGKATPGWITGEHYGTYLRHLQQNPLLILGGEFLFGIAFLLPFYVGIVLPAIIVVGMIMSVNWGIFDAVGPILGMLMTFVVYRESKQTPAVVTLPGSAAGRAIASFLGWLALPNLSISVGGHASAMVGGETVQGRFAWAALLERIPVMSVLCPVIDPSRLWGYR